MSEIEPTKQCTKCGEAKSLSSFYRKLKGIRSRCKKCFLAAGKIWAKSNIVERRKYVKNWRLLNHTKCLEGQQRRRKTNPESYAWSQLRGKIDSEAPGAFTRSMFKAFISHPCFYCGRSWKGETDYSSYWLDRIDNSKGYEIGNVLPCCGSCNKMRGNRYTVQETQIMVKALLAYRKEFADVR